MTIIVWMPALLAGAAVAYTLFAAWAVAGFGRGAAPVGPAEPVSLLKPLHGAEPRLRDNLMTFLDQDWAAPIEMVAGVQRADDQAIAVVSSLPATANVVLIRDATRHGGNAKVSNLINMGPAASHDMVVLSDSDMAVPRDYLRRLAGALGEPGVGAATCLYRGRGDAGRWSVLAAAGISYHFLPQLLVGLRLGLARPGMGSTIALRARTLAAAGGFMPFADSLADDYALGEAVRAQGLRVVVPAMMLVHGCDEPSLAAVWRHELRWAATILRINPGGQIGTILTYPIPLTLIACAATPRAGLALLALAVLARLLLWRTVDAAAARLGGGARRTASAWLLPWRDGLSFAVFVAAFFARSVDWRGSRLKMEPSGRVSAAKEFP
ncbi:bacteriohopanetetrol glucosamine biosynthesis glycosyltransferase HpnI [Sphingomonas sp.]|uniref:bacteriohopanetetrol glucosamine biosynthesis glycosyltransferase HpnI n=1 Tax=Sphingomonas sp. TaxID=28214 RepID=UPI003AFFCE29